ncbi:MAG: hypothetical protein K2Y71_07650 [Xanthobacteraceae bacterium]|nr:hypothetical protein [Xanthobacteraceae bacterium]
MPKPRMFAAAMTDHPPKPRLTLRVGVTGHRPNKLPRADLPRLERQLRDVFAAIENAVAKAYDANKAVYAQEPAGKKPYTVRLISGFAEGADQMATAAGPADWTVEAILPFPKDEYLKDFEQSALGDGRDVRGELLASLQRAAVVTELPTPPERNQGYVQCGNFLLRQIDILIAVWDGSAPQPGGTGAIAQEACNGGIPVVWIATGGERPIALIESFEDDKPVCARAPWSADALRSRLDPVLAAPAADALDGRSQRARLEQFYAESWPAPTRASSFDLLKRWATGQRPLRLTLPAEPRDVLVAGFATLVDEGPPAGPLSQRIKDVLAPRHAFADALAVHFSHLYRNAYVLAYLLAAAAVLIAVAGAYVENPVLKLALVAIELLVVVVIIQLVRHGGKNAWHERWIEYRLIAESLRYARFLAYVSEFGLINRKELTNQPWTLWYIRATLREIGLPGATLDRAYQWPLMQSVLRSEVREQRHWHENNADAMAKVDHFLHRSAERCFLYTFAALCIGVVVLVGIIVLLPEHEEHAVLKLAKPWLLLFAAGFPALGAALAGIRVQGEFEDYKERSEHMVAALNALEATYEAQLRQQPQIERTGALLIETARVLSEDLAAWQELYGRKRLNLPA